MAWENITEGKANLIIHAGGFKVSRGDLALIPTPKSTDTWKPLAHIDLANAIHEEAHKRGILVTREHYALQRRANMLVGIMVLNWKETEEFATALAFRNSHDMEEAVKFSLLEKRGNLCLESYKNIPFICL